MFSNDRNELRKIFHDSWKSKQAGATLDALQQMIVGVIEQHPEYHQLLESVDNLNKDYDPAQGETNPFLHMSMHIALIEQISTNRPDGIRLYHQQLTQSLGSAHAAEHQMMACLSETIWQAQRNNTAPDEAAYLGCLKNLVENG
jgi:hypothetical protein